MKENNQPQAKGATMKNQKRATATYTLGVNRQRRQHTIGIVTRDEFDANFSRLMDCICAKHNTPPNLVNIREIKYSESVLKIF